jgi:hypothetical protein
LKPKLNSLLSDGFTIIETMIVLAISMTIGITALIMLSHDIGEDNFSTAANNFSQKLQQDMVDSTNGSYNYTDLTCTPAPLGGNITVSSSSTNTQGTNYGCVSLGSAIQFYPTQSDGSNEYVIIPIDGIQYNGGDVIQNILLASPVPLEPPITTGGAGVSPPDLSQTERLEEGLKIVSVKACDVSTASCNSSTIVNTGAIAFLDGDTDGSLASGSAEDLNSGSLPTTLYYVKTTNINQTKGQVATEINASELSPAKYAQICITDGQKSYLFTISGTNTSQVTSQIYTGDNTCT